MVSEIGIPTYPKSALHLSQLTDGFKIEHDETTDHFFDPKQEGLTAISQGYPNTRGKHPSLHSGYASLTG